MIDRHDWCPWLFWEDATDEERRVQAAFQADLAATGRVRLGEGSFVSPRAGLVLDDLVLGSRCYVAGSSYVTGTVRAGDRCTINPFAVVRGRVTLGFGVRIGAHASVLGFTHVHDDPTRPICDQGLASKGIEVGDDVWIGSHAVILDGVRVGSHCVVAAGAVVTRDVPDFAVVAGNPARVVRDRRAPREPSLEALADGFVARVGEQWPEVLARCATEVDGEARYADAPGRPVDALRPCCDAIEVAALFDAVPPLRTRDEWVALLQATQDPESGVPIDPHRPNDPAVPLADLGDHHTAYQILSVGYALECLGASLRHPVHAAQAMTPERLDAWLDALPWRTHAWNAGCAVDALGTALDLNRRHFGLQGPISPLFDRLRARCSPHTGLWGESTAHEGWLFPVNGFYRTTRGTFAAFDLPVPHPEAAIDTVLAHARFNGGFLHAEGAPAGVTACNVLDVVHPLWLCGRHADWRRDEIRHLLERQVRAIPSRWIDGEGFGFAVGEAPGLQGTEMWLAIWLTAMAALGHTPLHPRGVHRL